MKNHPLSPTLIGQYFEPDTIRIRLADRVESYPFVMTVDGYLFNDMCLIQNYQDLYYLLTGIKATMVDGRGQELSPSQLSNRNLTDEDYLDEIIGITGVDRNILTNYPKLRKREYVITRQLHMMVRNLVFRESLAKSGEMYGKSHCSVLYAIKTIKNLRDTDCNFRLATNRLMFMIETHV